MHKKSNLLQKIENKVISEYKDYSFQKFQDIQNIQKKLFMIPPADPILPAGCRARANRRSRRQA